MDILFTCFCCSLQHVAACLYTNYTTICNARLVMKKSIHFWLGGMHILVNMECCCCFVFWEFFFSFLEVAKRICGQSQTASLHVEGVLCQMEWATLAYVVVGLLASHGEELSYNIQRP